MYRRELLASAQTKLQEQPYTVPVEIFVSFCNKNSRGKVWRTSGADFSRAWSKVERYLLKLVQLPRWVKIQIVTERIAMNFREACALIKRTERNNYFPYGLSLKKDGSCSFLVEEIVGSALLVPDKEHIVGKNRPNLSLHEKNLSAYIHYRNARPGILPALKPESEVSLFKTGGIFISENEIYSLSQEFFGYGCREINAENQLERNHQAIDAGITFLQKQLKPTGKFHYGYYPAYHKSLTGYNSVRHFSSLYALAESVEYLKQNEPQRSQKLLVAIRKGLLWGMENLAHEWENQLFIVDFAAGKPELKLGAQAMVVLALAKYEVVADSQEFRPQMIAFLNGMKAFIDNTGNTHHVLHLDLSVKEPFRIVYYDGEALFAIMRAYHLLQAEEWLLVAQQLMEQFIAKRYERYHDHWLSYSVNELTTVVPKPEYYEFGIRNAFSNLDFIQHRDTAYPTMLELLVAAGRMCQRIAADERLAKMLAPEKIAHLQQVMSQRVTHELRTGVMWPELAQFFARPETIVGGFYARHDRCRIRIDDAEHFLSGLINYNAFQKEKQQSASLKKAITLRA